MRKLSMDELQRKSVEEFRMAEKTPIVIVLDNVRSMHNVGAVFRTADAFLLQGVYLCGYTPVPPHRDIHKTALGATETVAWKYYKSVTEAIAALKAAGFAVWAVEQAEGSIPLQAFTIPQQQPIAIVFGNEVNGVGNDILQQAAGCIEIPQSGMKHSLNISVSAGIVVWDLFAKMNYHQTSLPRPG